nr:uncharacterized protein LOC119165435 [Rhipicephalus microplus]
MNLRNVVHRADEKGRSSDGLSSPRSAAVQQDYAASDTDVASTSTDASNSKTSDTYATSETSAIASTVASETTVTDVSTTKTTTQATPLPPMKPPKALATMTLSRRVQSKAFMVNTRRLLGAQASNDLWRMCGLRRGKPDFYTRPARTASRCVLATSQGEGL